MSTTTPTHRRGRALATALLSVPLSVTLIGSSIVAAHASVPPAPDVPAVAVESVGNGEARKADKAVPSSNSSEGAKTPSTSSGPLSSPQPLSNADKKGTGANPGETCDHAYCSTRDGSASQNGNGGGEAGGKPCAGCVGKADNKNPKGQAPDGTDHNNGYECDGNKGVGKGNPAHTGCSGTGGDGGTQPTTPPTPEPTTPTTPPTTTPTPTPSDAPGTATVAVLVDCFTVTVTSSKDISNVVVVFADGASTKFDGLRGTSWTRTFTTAVSSATAKSATTRVTGTATGCDTPTTSPSPSPSPTTPTTEPTPGTTTPPAEPTAEPTPEPTPPTGTSPELPGTVECPSGSTMQPGTGPGTGVDPVCTVPPVGPTPDEPGPVVPTCPAGSMPVSDTDPLVCVVPPTGVSPQLPGTAPTLGVPAASPLTPTAPVLPPARTPAATGTGVLAAGAAAPTALPFTGGETTLLVGLGMVLLGVGTLLLIGTRRRELTAA